MGILHPAGRDDDDHPSYQMMVSSQSIDARLAALLAAPVSTRVHLMGIGGAGLSAIARVLLQRGFSVSGCDRQESTILEELRELGASVSIGHSGSHAEATDLLLVSSAVAPDHPELAAAEQARRAGGQTRAVPGPTDGRPASNLRGRNPWQDHYQRYDRHHPG